MFGYAGMTVIEVKPGTEIEHGDQKATVTDDAVVCVGASMYVTAKMYAGIKAAATPKEGKSDV